MNKPHILLFFILLLLFACTQKEHEVRVQSVIVSPASKDLTIGETFQLIATVSPSNAQNKSITWSSSNSSVASVSSSGFVTALNDGIATITANIDGKKGECSVSVSKGFIAVSEIRFEKYDLSLYEGEEEILIAIVMPDNATDKTITWSTSDKSIVSVESGKVKAIKKGEAKVTAMAGEKAAEINISVFTPISGLSLDKEFLALSLGEKRTLKATISPVDAILKEPVIWKSSDETVAIVNDGEVTALAKGKASIMATANGKNAYCDVLVGATANEIYYTSKNGMILKPIEEAFGARIISNEYTNNQGVITFDQDLTYIGDYAFVPCYNITSIIIPAKVTSIGKAAFSDCSNLTSIYLPESLTTIGEEAFSYSGINSICLPKNLTSIGRRAFYECTVSETNLPSSLSSIGEEAFALCSNLTSIIIPEGICSLERLVFYRCSKLSSVTIPTSITRIGGGAFEDCTSLTKIDIPDGVVEIERGTFSGCSNLAEVRIPESVKCIRKYAFHNCGIISIDLPVELECVEDFAFWSCSKLDEIVLPENVTTLGEGVFCGCSSLKSANVPNNKKSITQALFEGCSSLTSINIPESVTYIGNQAFFHCSSLSSITIPKNVDNIGVQAFSGCTGLISVTVLPETPPLGDNFASTNDIVIYVSSSSIERYKAADNWKHLADRMQAITN